MPAREELLIVIKGDGKSAQKVFQGVGQQAEIAGKKIDKNLAERLQKTGKTMTGVGKTLSIGLTAPLAAFGGVAVNAAMKSQRLTNTLEGLAGGAKEAEEYVEAIGEASLGTVPRIDALAAANRALAFGIVKNKEEMGELTQIAITLGRAQGLTATKAVDDFATALSRSSPMILDNLGLQIKLTSAYKIYGDALGKTADELTDVEKKEAFRQAALIKGRELVAQMGGLQDDAAASAERMKAKMSDLAAEVGQHLMPIMSQGVSVLGTVVGQFDKLSESQKQLVIKLGVVAAAAGPAIGALGKMTSVAGTLIGSFEKIVDSAGSVSGAVKLLSGNLISFVAKAGAATVAAIALYKAYEEFEKQGDKARTAAEETESALDSLSGIAVDLAERFEDSDRAAKYLADKLKDLNRTTKENEGWLVYGDILFGTKTRAELLTDAFGEVQKAARDLSRDYESYLPIIDKYNSLQADARLKVQALGKEEYLHAQRLDLLIRAGVDYSKMQKEYTGQAEIIAAKTRTAGDAFRHLRKEALVATEVFPVLTRRQMEAHTALWTLQGGLRKLLAPALSDLRAEFRHSNISLDEYGEALRRITTNQEILAEETEWATELKRRHDEIAQAAEESARRQKAAADEAVRGQANLINAMQDATLEMFRQQTLAQIDPADIGLTAWAELGKELGLLTQTQVNLASASEQVSSAYRKGIVDVDNMAEVTSDLYDAAKKAGKVNEDAEKAVATLLDQYAKAPGLIGPSKKALERLNERLKLAGEDLLPKSEKAMKDFGEKAEETKTPIENLDKPSETLNERLRLMGEDVAPEATKAIGDLHFDVKRLGERIPRTNQGIYDFTEAHRRLRRPLRDSIEGVQDLKFELDQLPEQKIIDVIVRYTTIGVTQYVTPSGSPIPQQYGGVVPGRIGEPVLIMAHGGEEITNPYQRGARGGPGGPRPTNMPEYFGPFDISKVAQPIPAPMVSHDGDTVNYNIFNPLAAKMYSEMEYRRRRARFESGM